LPINFSDRYGVITYDDDNDASQSDDSTYQPSNDTDDDDPSDQGGPGYIDDDDADTSHLDEDDSSNTHSDDGPSNGEESESSNQSDEDSATDVMSDKDHSHSTPRVLTPVNSIQHTGVSSSPASSSWEHDSNAGVDSEHGLELSSSTVPSSPNDTSSTGVGLDSLIIQDHEHSVPALVDNLTPNSSESTPPTSALADNLTPSDSSNEDASPTPLHDTPPVLPPSLDEHMDAQYGPRLHGINLRPRRMHSYTHRYDHHYLTYHNYLSYEPTFGTVFLTEQMSLKHGLKMFGESGADAVVAELKQLDYRSVLLPKHNHQLSTQEKRDALCYLMYLKQKRSGHIKARGCADGRNSEHTSPMMRPALLLWPQRLCSSPQS